MSSQPLICFYKENQFIYCENFLRTTFKSSAFHLELGSYLKSNGDDLTVISISYPDRGECELSIFKLIDYRIVSKDQLNNLLSKYSKQQLQPEQFKRELTFKQYEEIFNATKVEIDKGNVYQVNMSFKFEAKWPQSSLYYFSKYQEKFLGDYFCYIPLVGKNLLSFSPELFIKKNKTTVTTMPIKGTVSTSAGPSELLDSHKENAELSMVVDLLRNDLNQIADISPSKVIKHRSLLELGNIIHTYSEISCESSKPIEMILEKTFPGGSITGCPKKSAMDLISRLEKTPRDYYTGSVGWVEGDDALFNILIRTFMHFDTGRVCYNSGGGIVSDSKLLSEYEEIKLKAEHLNE